MSDKASKTTTNSIKQTRLYHRRYLVAVNNPLRRKILIALRRGPASIEQLQNATGLGRAILEWHLEILEHGFCVEKICTQEAPKYKLTQEGKVVDYVG